MELQRREQTAGVAREQVAVDPCPLNQAAGQCCSQFDMAMLVCGVVRARVVEMGACG